MSPRVHRVSFRHFQPGLFATTARHSAAWGALPSGIRGEGSISVGQAKVRKAATRDGGRLLRLP